MASAALGTAYRHLRHLLAAGSALGLEDGPLLARFSESNDPAAFEALVARHGPMVLATCRAVLKNEHDAEDAFQATFLVLARKAGSVRGEALGGWLHRVAYRASVHASVQARKRRRKEAEASAMAPPDASPSVPMIDDELRPILHEEIDRLPESHRLPVVLCDLGGLTYEQAAEQLRWTLPTLRCRLARARQRLRSRLTRRGVDPLAVGPLLASKPAVAVVPPALLGATALAASGGPATAGAMLLAHTLLRGMLMTRIKSTSAAGLSALALAAAGMIATGAGRPDGPEKPSMKSAAKVEVAPKEASSGGKPMETVEVKGRVVAPDGKPVAGATIRGAYLVRDAFPWPSATSNPDGRFLIRMPKPGGAEHEGFFSGYPWLIATAPGYGVGWIQGALRADRPEEQAVTLVEEGPPIEGRVVDLEGRPVAGARVEAYQIFYEPKGDLPSWIARARNGAVGNLWQGLENLSLDPISLPARHGPRKRLAPISATSGVDGRFKLTGVGRDRIADLLISGPGVAKTQVHVFSRAEPEIRSSDRGMMKATPFVVHAPRLEVALAPSKRVEGVVRDQDTGKPIAGIEIHAGVFDEGSMIWAEGIETWTDAEGRYRLDGLPIAAAYRLFIKPEKGLPYLNGTFKAPADSPGLDPVAFDFALKRGIFVRGKVTDKVTGRPIGGYANYGAFDDNPHLRDYAGFSRGYGEYAYFDDDGRFELVALPGRGLIAVADEGFRYRPASGVEAIKGYDTQLRGFRTVPEIVSRSHAVIAVVEVDPKSEGVTLDLQADPGRSVTVEVVGPDGVPLGGTKARGLKEMFQTPPEPQESSGFEVRALEPGKPRRVIVMHEGRKLIGTALLRGDETGRVTIKLQPWGSIVGRIVDEEGQPRKGLFLGIPSRGPKIANPETDDILPGADWNNGIRAGDDGRFFVEGLVPGLNYDTTVHRAGFETVGDLFEDVTVAPGEVKDLGDLKLRPARPE